MRATGREGFVPSPPDDGTLKMEETIFIVKSKRSLRKEKSKNGTDKIYDYILVKMSEQASLRNLEKGHRRN